jgi:hypothetical protein
MKRFSILLAALMVAAFVPAMAATPKPKPTPHASVPVLKLPNEPLHSEYIVEVNKRGQVVRVKSSKVSKVTTFNVQTYGNALQMWIRKPNGSATVGLFKVTYDYNPKTHKVARNISLVSTGGSWANDEGAANVMLDTAKREAMEAAKQREKERAALPSLKKITGSSAKPSGSPLP